MGTTTGQRIKALRTKYGYTQDAMAERLGMNRANFSNYERDVATPPADTLSKIADLLHTTSDYLLGRTEDASPRREPAAPAWAAPRDKRDLRKMLEEEEVLFDGVPLSDEDKQRVQDVLTGLFWEAKMMNKRKKPPER
ncbi:helix-turn-helix transcriptional regulator [Paenibacillus sp.]|uniref:helix-turn-helix domain-containing protein n=1 Tax=Paenibacillus sp. TaxID=58172 RepID=UPI002811BDC7|nr:helix-turn-helix transcriptional regulator [Paenibacillus sp.]